MHFPPSLRKLSKVCIEPCEMCQGRKSVRYHIACDHTFPSLYSDVEKKTPDRKLVTTWYELLSLITTSLSLSERRAGKCKLSQAIMLSCQSMRLNLNWHLNIEFGWTFLRRLGGSGPGWKGREGNGWDLEKWARGVGMGAAGMGRRSASAPLLPLLSSFFPLSPPHPLHESLFTS